MSKKYKRTGIIFLSLVPLVAGASLVCLSRCQGGGTWTDYFDDPGEQERHQTATSVGEPVTYTFELKEAVPEGEAIYGDGKVVKVSHPGVDAKIDNVKLGDNRKTVTFDAQITNVPKQQSNKLTTYSADFEVEVQRKKQVDDEIVWTTTIEELTLEVEVDVKTLTIEDGPTQKIIAEAGTDGSDSTHPFTIKLDGETLLSGFNLETSSKIDGISINENRCVAWTSAAKPDTYTFSVKATYTDASGTYTAESNTIILELKAPTKELTIEGGPKGKIVATAGTPGSDSENPFIVKFAGSTVTPDTLTLNKEITGIQIDENQCVAWSGDLEVKTYEFQVVASYTVDMKTYTATSGTITLDVQETKELTITGGPTKTIGSFCQWGYAARECPYFVKLGDEMLTEGVKFTIVPALGEVDPGITILPNELEPGEYYINIAPNLEEAGYFFYVKASYTDKSGVSHEVTTTTAAHVVICDFIIQGGPKSEISGTSAGGVDTHPFEVFYNGWELTKEPELKGKLVFNVTRASVQDVSMIYVSDTYCVGWKPGIKPLYPEDYLFYVEVTYTDQWDVTWTAQTDRLSLKIAS